MSPLYTARFEPSVQGPGFRVQGWEVHPGSFFALFVHEKNTILILLASSIFGIVLFVLVASFLLPEADPPPRLAPPHPEAG